MHDDVVRRWTPRAALLAGFAAYALLAPPGPYWLDDSGELGAAAFQLGSPHPTGFPLYLALAKLATLVPIGELAFRLHLLSAAAAAVALYLVAALVAEVGGNRRASCVAGAAAALLLGVTLTFARQASVAEVHALTAALLAAALYLYDRVARGGEARFGLGLALVAGLGMGAHPSFRLLFALPLVLLLFVRLRRGARWPLLVPVVAVAAAAAVHLVLPVRSATGRTAAVDWGHPRRAGALVAHVGAAEIHAAEGLPEVRREDAAVFLGGVGDQLGSLAVLAALVGAVFLARDRRSRWLLFALAAVVAGDALYAIARGPIESGVPLLLGACVLAGAGLVWLGRFAGLAGGFAAAGAGAILLVGPVMVSWPALAPVGEGPRRVAEAALDAAPPRSVVPAAGVLFLQVTEGARPDVMRQPVSSAADARSSRSRRGSTRVAPGEEPVQARSRKESGRAEATSGNCEARSSGTPAAFMTVRQTRAESSRPLLSVDPEPGAPLSSGGW